MDDSLYIAVDLGAGSGRVFLTGMAPGEFLLEEVRRFKYPPKDTDGHLRWDLPNIFEEIRTGLREAGERAKQLKRPVYSIGVDSWGVDYGLVDTTGSLLQLPVCYRDKRTEGIMEKVFAQVSQDEIFERTGIQFLVFNTLFQLYAQVNNGGTPNGAARLLMIPDLINLQLTGRVTTEFTNATTTQLINARTGTWDLELLQRLNLPIHLWSEIVPAGTDLGLLKESLATEVGLHGVRVIAPATHDTGSAVAGAPLEEDWAYISSGTWSLVGIELNEALINSEVARYNFTNEGGAFGTVRFLKNVMGLWILENCRREWQERGIDVDYEKLLGQLNALEDLPHLIFPDDARFLNPPSMLNAIAEQLMENGHSLPQTPALISKLILESLAHRYADIVRTIEKLSNRSVRGLEIVGGGSQNDYLNQMTANTTGLSVIAGPIEATVIGNVLVQAIASGRFSSLSEARNHVRENIKLRRYEPRQSSVPEEALARKV